MIEKNTNVVHFYSIDVLRGVAAVVVCFYHFTNGFLPNGNPMKWFFQYGYLGVESFFLISGFIVVYSLAKKKYQLSNFRDIFLKRFWRLEPAYWASILLMLGMDCFASYIPGFEGQSHSHSIYNLFLHFFHLNALLGQPWVRDVYWTLAIDWQFYLTMCLIFPLVTHSKMWLRLLTLLAFAALTPFFSQYWVFYYSFAFIIGILFYYKYEGTLNNIQTFSLILLSLYGNYHYLGVTHLSSLIISVICFAFFDFRQSIFSFLGKISYSLYLTHIFSGWAVCTIFHMFGENEWLMCFGIVVGVATSIAFSNVFYQKVEQNKYFVP